VSEMRQLGQLQSLKIISSLLLLSLFVFLPESARCQRFPEEIVSHLKAGQLEEARASLQDFRSFEPDDPRGLYYAGWLEPNGELSTDLLKSSLTSGKDFPERGQALLRLGQYYLSKSMYLTAASQARQSLEVDSTEKPGALWIQGTANSASEKSALAIENFQEILKSSSEHEWGAWAKLGLGDVYYQEGDYVRAQSSYREVLQDHRESPAYSLALAQFAQCQWELDDPASGERFAKEYLQEFPGGVFAGTLRDLVSAGVIRSASEEEKLSPKERARLTSTAYSVQVGAFASKANAYKMAQRLQARGYKIELRTETINRRRFYKVLVGRFLSEESAQEVKQKLEAEEGEDFMIVIR
jgi:tetratricopeptide (TPR) repeat protein